MATRYVFFCRRCEERLTHVREKPGYMGCHWCGVGFKYDELNTVIERTLSDDSPQVRSQFFFRNGHARLVCEMPDNTPKDIREGVLVVIPGCSD